MPDVPVVTSAGTRPGTPQDERGKHGRICRCVACYFFLVDVQCVFLPVDALCVGGSGVFGVLTFLGQMVSR